MTGLRANGAMVATYWSVSVTVRIAHTEITETGIRIDASTTSTHAEIRRGRCPRRVFVLVGADSVSAFAPASGSAPPPSTAASGGIWGSVSLIWAFPLPNA